MSEKEKRVIAMFEKAIPDDEKLFDTSSVNQLAWSLLVIAIGLIIWLTIALVNAENQRNAYATNACPDPVFKGAVDARCMKSVKSREHWWQHVTYAITHVAP